MIDCFDGDTVPSQLRNRELSVGVRQPHERKSSPLSFRSEIAVGSGGSHPLSCFEGPERSGNKSGTAELPLSLDEMGEVFYMHPNI